MSCALTDNAGYPDYLKSILREIAAGNDDELKTCACQLKTPTTDGGCPILDEDDKVVAFPFCLRDTNPNLTSSIDFYTSDIGLSYKEAMKLYWKRTRFDIAFNASGSVNLESEECPVLQSSASTSLESDIVTLKDLVCGVSKGASISNLNDQGKPGFACRTDSCCGAGCNFYGAPCFYFGVEFNIFLPYLDNSRAWIDKEAQLIYPYIYGYESLSGCCGNMGPNSWTVSSGKITINTTPKSPGFTGAAYGKIIVSF